MNVLIVGRGRVGNGLRRALAKSTHSVAAAGRSVPRAKVQAAQVVVIAVPDDAIERVSETIAPNLRPRAIVLHCAGARGLAELRACEERGASVGVMHPLVSFPAKRANPSLGGTTFTLSGEPRAIAAGKRIASACGARTMVGPTGDPAYHAAAAMAANGAAALAFASVSLLESLGFDARSAEHAIGGLLRTVGENVQRIGVPDALTGPVARGEANVIDAHRAAVGRRSKGALAAYDAILPVVVRCARAAGLSRTRASKILDTLKR